MLVANSVCQWSVPDAMLCADPASMHAQRDERRRIGVVHASQHRLPRQGMAWDRTWCKGMTRARALPRVWPGPYPCTGVWFWQYPLQIFHHARVWPGTYPCARVWHGPDPCARVWPGTDPRARAWPRTGLGVLRVPRQTLPHCSMNLRSDGHCDVVH